MTLNNSRSSLRIKVRQQDIAQPKATAARTRPGDRSEVAANFNLQGKHVSRLATAAQVRPKILGDFDPILR